MVPAARTPRADRKGPDIPKEETETVRRSLLALLEQGPRTAIELSAAVRRPQREVLAHLEHLRRSLRRGSRRLELSPAECRNCGFVFRKRARVTSPGRCPLCKGESVSDPVFRVE